MAPLSATTTARPRLATAYAAVAQAAELAAARPQDPSMARIFRQVLGRLEAELRAASAPAMAAQ